LDELAGHGLLKQQTPLVLGATFNNPVSSGEAVTLQVTCDGTKIRMAASAAGAQAFTASIELQKRTIGDSSVEDAQFTPARPDEVDFPPSVNDGTVPLRLSESLLRELFPALAASDERGWIADLLATTQIVGMRCPGMH